ncbi:MAG TPA: hypothetical protein VNL95_08665 [Dehalococcoidia bacterium]|nr:hypothetical protein [Dehalococcoidia bacterium]
MAGRRLWAAAYVALLAALLAGTGVVGWRVLVALGPQGPVERLAAPYGYSTLRWELAQVPQKLAVKLGGLLRREGEQEREEGLRRYLQAAARLRRITQQPELATPGEREDILRRMSRDENDVELLLEGRITSLLAEAGLTVSPPLFGRLNIVFPPVAVELGPTPKVLAVSPRQRIVLQQAFLLTPRLSPGQRDALEQAVDATGLSSLVVDVGGLGAYPSIVPASDDYAFLVETAIHEWVHHYLALYPLGRNYFRSQETRTINESVADLVAEELTLAYFRRYPMDGSLPPLREWPPALVRELRSLRQDVEALLRLGQVEEAEALMEARRQELASQGYYIRRLNQAYFAFFGLYADNPASASAVGPKLAALRLRAGSLRRFLEMVRGITSEGELDALLTTP